MEREEEMRIGFNQEGSYWEIPLTNGLYAKLDEADWRALGRYTWSARFHPRTGTYYALTSFADGNKTVTFLMHRVILRLPLGDPRKVDHENHDTLDNRRCNIRIATASQNNMNRKMPRTNTSGFKGVSRRGSKWSATITAAGVRHRIGLYDSAEAAAVAYDQAAVQYHGEFARLNFHP